ncbi:hypothetical protein EVAR_26875_1 [Eumeta japonica]|uniref:Uncharacterized protein n=1 Tax=Eumeta variegata TaxID=151549 RepID=A0A4C1VZD1_EUMVA|nr:hypothetical protein EVAR_26875_1 [Eumeta japonica]
MPPSASSENVLKEPKTFRLMEAAECDRFRILEHFFVTARKRLGRRGGDDPSLSFAGTLLHPHYYFRHRAFNVGRVTPPHGLRPPVFFACDAVRATTAIAAVQYTVTRWSVVRSGFALGYGFAGGKRGARAAGGPAISSAACAPAARARSVSLPCSLPRPTKPAGKLRAIRLRHAFEGLRARRHGRAPDINAPKDKLVHSVYLKREGGAPRPRACAAAGA